MTYHSASTPSPQNVNGYDWQAHTERALVFLYGLNHHETRKAMTEADLAAWRALGSKKP